MKSYNILWLMLLSMIVVSCSEESDVTSSDGAVACEVFLSVGQPGGMRMPNEVVQADGNFRMLQDLWVVPFRTENARPVKVGDVPLLTTVSGSTADRVDGKSYYYINQCSFMLGTNRVLAYGRVTPVSGSANNGAIETNLVKRMLLGDLTFNLRSICNSNTPSSDALALAKYMTDIANTEGWSASTNSQMKGLYHDFINADSEGSGLMGGSAKHIYGYVKELETQLEGIHDAYGTSDDVKSLCTAIINNIKTNKSCLALTYPSSIGLPDGAAVIRWTGAAFEPRTEWSALDNINSITRFTYPAELWYYANSGILTSLDDVKETPAYTSSDSWSSLLSAYYKGGASVVQHTKAIAVNAPLQYGVARLQMTLKRIPASPILKDSKGNYVVVEDGYADKLPLTGVIIGGQHTVGFDFTPKGPKSDVDARFIYDPNISNTVSGGDDDGDKTINTLVLQSYDNEIVPVVLEFTNGTGKKFHGIDGVIYPGAKFYLIAQLDPEGAGSGDYANRVFTQDYTTSVTMKVVSLAKAYSCMPDLLEARLEIGVQIVKQWIQSTTTTVKL